MQSKYISCIKTGITTHTHTRVYIYIQNILVTYKSKALGNAEYISLPSTHDLLWPSVVAPDRVLCMGEIGFKY